MALIAPPYGYLRWTDGRWVLVWSRLIIVEAARDESPCIPRAPVSSLVLILVENAQHTNFSVHKLRIQSAFCLWIQVFHHPFRGENVRWRRVEKKMTGQLKLRSKVWGHTCVAEGFFSRIIVWGTISGV